MSVSAWPKCADNICLLAGHIGAGFSRESGPSRKTGTYFTIPKFLEIGTVVIPHFPVVDNIAPPFCVCSHGSGSVTLVITTIDLLCCQAQASRQGR